MYAEVSVGFMLFEKSEELFIEAKQEEINEFPKVFLEATFGIERVDR